MVSDDKKQTANEKPQKLSYQKPEIKSEPLTTVAALCNGVTPPTGGRKASTGAPNFCQASKLKS